MKSVYLDHAATTPLDPRVVSEMLPYFERKFGNASSIHKIGREAREAVEKAREITAASIGAKAEEIVFTSGGTESDNLAVKGVAYALKGKGRHLITSTIEHPAVMESFKDLESEGFKISYIPVDRDGIIDIHKLKSAVTPKTTLISVMHANNEVGTIQPLREIVDIAEENCVYLHTDAVQTLGKLPIDMNDVKTSLLSISGHKIHGPKGVGALFIREGVEVKPLLSGGEHERGLRSGTENSPGIIGLSVAADIAVKEMDESTNKMSELRDYMIKEVLERVPKSQLTGHSTERLSNNVHFCFSGIDGESLVLALDQDGIAASTGSACSSRKHGPSHVLLAMGLDSITSRGSLRLTLGKENKRSEIRYTIEAISRTVEELRKLSPINHR